MPTLFITGGNGFIGRNLKEQLAGEFEILAPTHQELELRDEGAVRRFFREHRIDVVIHSATKPGHRAAVDPTDLLYSNTRMFINLVRNRDRFRKMILLTSGAVYDMRHYIPKMPEGYFDTHVPVDESGYSKYLCAKLAEHMDNIIELRPFGVFGKYEDWRIRFISNMICKALCDLPLTMKQNRRFDYLWIDDLVRIIRYFIMNEPAHAVYNVTPDTTVELRTLAEVVCEIAGRELEIVIEKPDLGLEYSGENTRLRAEIKDLRLTDHRQAITTLFHWYAGRPDRFDRQQLLFDL